MQLSICLVSNDMQRNYIWTRFQVYTYLVIQKISCRFFCLILEFTYSELNSTSYKNCDLTTKNSSFTLFFNAISYLDLSIEKKKIQIIESA